MLTTLLTHRQMLGFSLRNLHEQKITLMVLACFPVLLIHTFVRLVQIQGLPTMVFVSDDKTKNAIRTEGLLSADQIKEIIEKEL
jgi:hypothetical protein